MRLLTRLVLVLVAAAFCPSIPAKVVSSGSGGFTVQEDVVYQGPEQAAWQRLIRPELWWSSEHTYTGDAVNLYLSLQPSGCWCETLPNGGFVQHMQVVYVAEPRSLRLFGGLGPLQKMGASGTLSFSLKPLPSGSTRIVAEYNVSGYAPSGFAKLAPAVDAVLLEQLKRLTASP
jgi:hypothetical protein